MTKSCQCDHSKLREISLCPPDCPLEKWVKILANLYDETEGGQKVAQLEEYVGNNMLMSDYRSVDHMRKELEYYREQHSRLINANKALRRQHEGMSQKIKELYEELELVSIGKYAKEEE